jgi:hypothetical protein
MADTLTDARLLIEGRLAELRKETTQLERALRALVGGGNGRPPRQRRAANSRRRQGKTVTRAQRMDSLANQARKAAGASNAELAKALGVTPSYISQLLAEGKRTGRVFRRKGKLIVGKTKAKTAGASGRKVAAGRRNRRSTARAKSASAAQRTTRGRTSGRG